MRTRVLSWRPRVTFCGSSSGNHYWGYRSFDRTRYIYESDNLGWSCRIHSESSYDLGRDAAVLQRGSAASGRGRIISELRSTGARTPGPTRRYRASYRHRLEHKSRLPAGG